MVLTKEVVLSSSGIAGWWLGIARPGQVVMLAGLVSIALIGAGCSMTVALDGPRSQGMDGQGTAGADPQSAVGVLTRMLEHDDPDVRVAAIRELRDMGPAARDAAPELRKLTEERDRLLRYEAARALVAVAPQDPVAAPALVMIAKDPGSSDHHRRESVALLEKMGRGAEVPGPGAGSAAATRPANARRDEYSGPAPLKVTDVREQDSDAAESPRSVRIDAATRPAASAQGERESPEGPAMPATRPSAPPADDPLLQIPGLWRSTDLPGSRPPAPDIDEHGINSYTATEALLVKQWLDRQPGSAAEKRQRWEEFVKWRSEQDRQIYAKVVNR
jgi:hypothetical protein